jgi:hypothetical protein
MGNSFFSYPCKSVSSVVRSLLFPEVAQGLRTDDDLWRVTRRHKGRWIKDKLSTRRGLVQSIGWFYLTPPGRRNFVRGEESSIHQVELC